LETDHFLYLFEAVTVGSAAGVLFSRNLFNSVLLFLTAMLGVACIFATIGANFIFIAQIAIYGGGISVLMLFTIMMAGNSSDAGKRIWNLKAAILPAILLNILLVKIFNAPLKPFLPAATSVQEIGHQLADNYIFVFEYSTILLLVALIGSMLISTQKNKAS
jgi:NADH-quinone oxidoreductase subunit J